MEIPSLMGIAIESDTGLRRLMAEQGPQEADRVAEASPEPAFDARSRVQDQVGRESDGGEEQGESSRLGSRFKRLDFDDIDGLSLGPEEGSPREFQRSDAEVEGDVIAGAQRHDSKPSGHRIRHEQTGGDLIHGAVASDGDHGVVGGGRVARQLGGMTRTAGDGDLGFHTPAAEISRQVPRRLERPAAAGNRIYDEQHRFGNGEFAMTIVTNTGPGIRHGIPCIPSQFDQSSTQNRKSKIENENGIAV
jgi:hypothetical protein